jgi:hypothetical protein
MSEPMVEIWVFFAIQRGEEPLPVGDSGGAGGGNEVFVL